jgi:hypothetical protein
MWRDVGTSRYIGADFRRIPLRQLIAIAVLLCARQEKKEDGFIGLFNGKDLTGWKAGENTDTWKVEDGHMVTHGPRSHLFYVGEVNNHVFKNFELRADVLCKPVSNSGIYIHTEYQEKNWPDKGFECQICTDGFKDARKTGSIYGVKDLDKSPVKDDEWFEYHILVQGKKIEIRMNGKTVNEWTQPDDYQPKMFKGRIIGSGTIALQGHDAGSIVWFKNVRIKPMAD